MPKYSALLAFNAPCYWRAEIEADSDEEAIAKFRAMANEPEGWDFDGSLADEHRVVSVENEADETIAEDLEASDVEAA